MNPENYILDGNDAIARAIGDDKITFTYEESKLPKEFRDVLKNRDGQLVLVDVITDDELPCVLNNVLPVTGYGTDNGCLRYVFDVKDLFGAKDVEFGMKQFGMNDLVTITYDFKKWKCA